MLHCWLAAVILQEDGDDQEPVEGEIAGFNFTRLSQRFPELKKELKSYKALLSESSNELKPLKVWQMQGNVYIVSLLIGIIGWLFDKFGLTLLFTSMTENDFDTVG